MAKSTEKRKHGWGLVALRLLSGTLLFFVSFAYEIQIDPLYAITIWPALVWCLPGFLLLLPGIRRYRGRHFWWVLGGWILFAAVFSEEPIGILHSLRTPVLRPDLTVVSLNCEGGNPLAADEVAAYKPDLVLLQESPSSMEVADLAKKLYGKEGASLPGRDASIVVHGTLEPIPLPRSTSDFVAAHVTLWNGRKLDVVSLRLSPPVFRLDYWSPDCWSEYADSRIRRREELARIVDYLKIRTGDAPMILGGDCNAPPDPVTFQSLKPRLRDAYPESGTFWGYTAVNDFPLARIDQIWVSYHFKPLETTAFKTEHSDHRLVRCYLRFAPE